jgi:hypothetical protein
MVKGIWGFNKHEKDEKFINKKTLEGGTGLVAFEELATWMNSAGSGTEPSCLGRWTFMEFRGADGRSAVVLSGYVPCKNNRPNTGTLISSTGVILSTSLNVLTAQGSNS